MAVSGSSGSALRTWSSAGSRLGWGWRNFRAPVFDMIDVSVATRSG